MKNPAPFHFHEDTPEAVNTKTNTAPASFGATLRLGATGWMNMM